MNIGFVTDTGYNYISGAARSTQRFCELLSKQGHKVVILTSRRGGQTKIEYEKNIMFRRFSGVPLPRFQKQAYFALPLFYPVFHTLKKEDIQVLHVTEPTFLGFSAIVAARVLGIPVVVSSHIQSENVAYNTALSKKWIRRIFDRYLVFFYGDADMIIFPSIFAKRLLAKQGLSISSKVISNGVDTDLFRPREISAFRKEKGFAGAKVILSVSRLMYEKRIDVILRSMPSVLKTVPEAHLVIVGHGLLRKKLQQLSKSLKISRHVTFTGLISDDDLKKYYSCADVFVSASLVELEGMSLLEAMSSGCPVIVADSEESAAPSLVHGNGFLFQPNNTADLSQKIVHIISQSEVRKKFRQKSLDISKRYDIHVSIHHLEDAYKEVMRRKGSGRNKFLQLFSRLMASK